jgi:hypothetical protein
MAVTATSLRADFPVVASATNYPDAMLNFWLNFATLILNTDRWGSPALTGQPNTLYDTGQELIAVHNAILDAKSIAEAANGAVPGLTTGPIASKSVDKVSVSYDVQAACNPKAEHWNLTVYGTRYAQLADMMGAGGFFIGFDQGLAINGPAWPGPYPYPGWFSN